MGAGVQKAHGGGTDVSSRKLADLVGKALGQEIIAENKAGAGGLTAARFLAKSKPDGYTIGGVVSPTFLIAPNFQKIDFDPVTAFVPITQVFGSSQWLQVKATSSIKTFKDFLKEGRERQITIGTSGVFTFEYLAMRRLADEAKINVKLVPYNGLAAAVMAVMGGHIDACAGGGNLEYVRAGKTRIIARLNPEATGPISEIPSLQDLGYDIQTAGFLGIFGPRGLPGHIQKRLEEEFTRAVHDPSITKFLESSGQILVSRSGNVFGNFLRESSERYRNLIKEYGLGIYAKEKK